MNQPPLEGLWILHIHTLPVVSGSGINTFLTMQGSRAGGARVGLACAPGGRLEELVRNAGMDFYPIRNLVSEISPLKDLHAFLQLERLLAGRQFDIIHTHNSKAGFIGRLAARGHRGPIVIHTVHGFAFHEAENWFFRRLFILLERAAAHWCDEMICISQPMIEWAVRERIAPRAKLVKIYSGIEVEKFENPVHNPELKTGWGITNDDFVIGIVSKLWKGKGHDLLIDAVSRLVKRGHEVKLLIVGEGHLERELRAQVKRLELGKMVVFTGFRSDVPEITALLDVSVLPSAFEGMGRVVLEAMAARKPVVATAVGGLTELVEEGRTGFLVRPADVEALCQRLETLIADRELRRKMGEEARNKLTRDHSAAAMVERIHEVYARHLRF